MLPRAARPRSSRRCWRRIPTRSRRTTSSSSPTPVRRRPGTGRIGTSSRPRSARFARAGGRARCRRPRTASGSPATRTAPYAGWRCAGERATSCSTRCGRTDADVYVTSDLRHHPASEFLEQATGPALVDVAHWAAEWTWLPVVAAKAEARRWAIRWRPGSARCAPTHGPAGPNQEKSAESRPGRPAHPARRPGARLPGRPAAPPARDAARARRDRRAHGRACRARRPAPRRADLGRRPDRRAEQGRRRRRAGQDAAHPRPGPDGPGADRQPQGPRADAGRAASRSSAGSPPWRTRSSR